MGNNKDGHKPFTKEEAAELMGSKKKEGEQNTETNQCPEFPHFGARYPDARCIDGFLWDLDSSTEENGEQYLTHGGDDPCPFCNTESYLEYAVDEENGVTKEKVLKHIEYLKQRYGR